MKTTKFLLAAIFIAAISGTAFADRHHERGSDGVVLASQIVGLVRSVVAPPTVIIRETPPVIVQQPVVVQQPAVVYEQPPVIYPQTTVIYTQPAPVVVRPAPRYYGRPYRPAPPPPRGGRW